MLLTQLASRHRKADLPRRRRRRRLSQGTRTAISKPNMRVIMFLGRHSSNNTDITIMGKEGGTDITNDQVWRNRGRCMDRELRDLAFPFGG